MRASARWSAGLIALVAGGGCASAPQGSSRQGDLVQKGLCAEPRVVGGRILPSVAEISPGEGPGLGGTLVTISGDGFVAGAEVQIGESPCTDVKVNDQNQLTCVTTSHPGGAAEVLVINPDRRCGLISRGFRYIANVMINPRSKVVAVGNIFRFSAGQGRPPYTYQLVSGDGAIDASTGEYRASEQPGRAVVRVTDAGNSVSDAVVSINPALQIVETKNGGVGGYHFEVIGGAPPVTYSMQPSGGDESTSVEGLEIPKAVNSPKGTVVRVEDSMGNHAEIALDITRVAPLVMHPAVTAMVPGETLNFTVAGGKPPYTYTIEGRGKIRDQTGLYTAPTEAGTDIIRVTDAAGTTAQASITIAQEALSVSRISLGYGHSCALANNSVRCWGDNRHGQLGTGDLIDRRKPYPVLGLGKDVSSISAGHTHTCALTTGGMAKCWGDNQFGQLGDSSNINSSTPVTVFGLHSGVQAISAGQYHSCGIARGQVFCWGSNRRGQLGNGSPKASTLPVAVRGLDHGYVSLATGAAHSCALNKDGGVKCWGYNYSGQLGDGTVQDHFEPVDVMGLQTGVSAIYAGGFHTCALLTGGKLKCWGNNGMGQLGNNTTNTSLEPVDVVGLDSPVKFVAAGSYHTCVVTGSETKCWGFNHDGQIGNPSFEVRALVPSTVPNLTEVVGLAVGANHSCALVPAGIRCWGSNVSGQFGDRSVVSSAIPIPPTPIQ